MARTLFVPTIPVTEQDVHAYESAWADKMVEIWREKIMQYRIRHTGQLFESVGVVSSGGSGRVIAHKFLEYGLYQDRGTGRETPIDYAGKPKRNGGDIGRDKVRKERPWYNRKYFASVRKLVDAEAAFYGIEYTAAVASAVKAMFEGKVN